MIARATSLIPSALRKKKKGERMNDTIFNVLCNIAQTISREQSMVLEMVITDEEIVAHVVPLSYLEGDYGEDD